MAKGVAFIGFGGMAGWHHKVIADRVPEFKMIGAYDIRQEALKKAARLGLKAYGSMDELLEDPEVEIVIIATPNDVHKDQSIRCMEAGKHVICEKPVTLNAQELEEIIAARDRTGMLFSVHQNRRWDKDFCIVRQVLREGAIGQPYFVESRVQGSRGAMHGWRGHRQNGGGMTLDWGVHLIDQAMQLFPESVISVDGHLFNLYSDEVDDNIKIFLRFRSGTSVQLEMSTNCFINHPRWHVSGTEGTMVVENWNCDGKLVKLKQEGAMAWGDDIVYTAAGPTRTMAPRPLHTTQELPLPELTSDAADYYRNVAQVLDGKAELLVTAEQALRVMRVIDAVFESERLKQGIQTNI